MDDRELCQNFGNLDESNKFLQKLPNVFLKDGINSSNFRLCSLQQFIHTLCSLCTLLPHL